MTADEEGSVSHCFRMLKAGDRSAMQALWDHFFPRLLGLARKTLGDCYGGVADVDDAVQSALISFWQRVERGDLDGPRDRDSLWNLLAVITVRKSFKHRERENAQKRGGGKKIVSLTEEVAQIRSQDFDTFCSELLDMLDDQCRRVAIQRLVGYKNKEIAESLGCTERSIERKLHLIRLCWAEEMSS